MTDTQKAFTGQTSFNRYASDGERAVARRLVRAAIKLGYYISVNDGEEWTVTNASSEKPVLDALCTTGEDTLRFSDPNGATGPARVGTMFLVWGNAEDGEELIADHTDNDAMLALYEQVITNA